MGHSLRPKPRASLFGLAPHGVYLATDVTTGTGGLLHHPFTLTARLRGVEFGGLLSVALAVGFPRLAVNQHAALWSSDFPPRRHATRRHSETTHPPIISMSFAAVVVKKIKIKSGPCESRPHPALFRAFFEVLRGSEIGVSLILLPEGVGELGLVGVITLVSFPLFFILGLNFHRLR